MTLGPLRSGTRPKHSFRSLSKSLRSHYSIITDTFRPRQEDIPAYTLIATQTPRPDPSKGATSSPDFTAIIMTLLRLEKEKTDVLITINVPHIKGEYDEEEIDLQLGKQGQLIGDAVEFAARIWGTFRVEDWKLFDA
jgi:hypothetical protein